MVEFLTYYGPMDKEYHESMTEVAPEPPKVEEPIFPISQLGETVPEHDPTGRFKNMIQQVQAAIRGGAGTLQIVLQTPPESAIGGRPKAYGKEIRETLREVAKANEVMIAGVELPTSLNNMSGFDYQNLMFSEEKRAREIAEVKDAIKFAADVAQGGGVDIVSWEFPRQVNEAAWNKDGIFEAKGEIPIGWVVDDRTGRTMQFRKTEAQWLPYDPKTFKPLADKEGRPLMDPETGKPMMKKFGWDEFQRWAAQEKTNPEKKYIDVQIDSQIKTLEGWSTYHMRIAEGSKKEADTMRERMREAERTGIIGVHPVTGQQIPATPEALERLRGEVEHLDRRYQDEVHAAQGQLQQARELTERKEHLKPISDFAFNKSVQSYAEAGLSAYDETHANPNARSAVHVGPENGWPMYYGSHPTEFINLIREARKDMANRLVKERGLPPAQAREEARRHVKGVFDTSHMGMWLAHFKPLPGENEQQRLERFNKWYLEQVDDIAKEDVVGGIQLVDSMSAAHGHLPPGQGIFPVKDAARIFKQHGYSGFLVSEGHEEERFGEGRIRLKTWEALGAPISTGYAPPRTGAPVRWHDIHTAYFGRTYSPSFIFGAYSPSNEFVLWSQVPLE